MSANPAETDQNSCLSFPLYLLYRFMGNILSAKGDIVLHGLCSGGPALTGQGRLPLVTAHTAQAGRGGMRCCQTLQGKSRGLRLDVGKCLTPLGTQTQAVGHGDITTHGHNCAKTLFSNHEIKKGHHTSYKNVATKSCKKWSPTLMGH